ncbi:MAG: nitric oxide reductase transcription regulator, partial [Janthinobacterium sp.]
EQCRLRMGLSRVVLSPGARTHLLSYGWPGNVRELEHVISRAALKAVIRGADRKEIVTLEKDMLDLDALEPPAGAGTPSSAPAACDAPAAPLLSMHQIVETSQRQAIRQALARHQDNWAAAARQLGLDASNLHKLARRVGIKA